MLDIKFIRENLDLCKEAAINKNRVVDWDKLLLLDEKRRTLIAKRDNLKSQKNKVNDVIKAALQKLSPEKAAIESERKKAIEEALKASQPKEELDQLEKEIREVEEEFNQLMYTVPNVPDKSVPIGKDSSGNKEVRKVGSPTIFDFPIKDHIALGKSLDLIDLERGAKVGGSRAYFLKTEGAQLEFAVLFYTF